MSKTVEPLSHEELKTVAEMLARVKPETQGEDLVKRIVQGMAGFTVEWDYGLRARFKLEG
jgi:hypothetical protein